MKALKTKIRGLEQSQFKRLRELTHHAKNLYNQTLWTLRQAFESTGFYFPYPSMDKVMKQVPNLAATLAHQGADCDRSGHCGGRDYRTSNSDFVAARYSPCHL